MTSGCFNFKVLRPVAQAVGRFPVRKACLTGMPVANSRVQLDSDRDPDSDSESNSYESESSRAGSSAAALPVTELGLEKREHETRP